MNKVLYYMSLISEALFLIMVLILLPFIVKSGFSGGLFITTVMIYSSIRLFMIIAKQKVLQKVTLYNILTITLTFYLGIIFTRIMVTKLNANILYELSMDYCKNNFFLIALTMICMILNTIILLFSKDARKQEKIGKFILSFSLKVRYNNYE